MNRPSYVIVHCSDSTWADGVATIADWHRQRGFGGGASTPCGYHYVIRNGFATYAQVKQGVVDVPDDGRIESGRREDEWGAHCIGYNDRSIGVCLVGPGRNGGFSERQLEAARELVGRLRRVYGIPVCNVLGHRETASGASEGKTCPMLDMDAFRGSLAPKDLH